MPTHDNHLSAAGTKARLMKAMNELIQAHPEVANASPNLTANLMVQCKNACTVIDQLLRKANRKGGKR